MHINVRINLDVYLSDVGLYICLKPSIPVQLLVVWLDNLMSCDFWNWSG